MPPLSPQEFETLSYFHDVTCWARAFVCLERGIKDVSRATLARRRFYQSQDGRAPAWLCRISQHLTSAHQRAPVARAYTTRGEVFMDVVARAEREEQGT